MNECSWRPILPADKQYGLVLAITFQSYDYKYGASFHKMFNNFQILSLILGSQNGDTTRKDKFTKKSIILFKLRIVKLNSDQFVRSPHLSQKKILISGVVIVIFPEDVFFFWAQDFNYKYFLLHIQTFIRAFTREMIVDHRRNRP